ncbi:MAG: sigma-70 family RNA polymerase sigma factor [Acidobacteriota bacterium]
MRRAQAGDEDAYAALLTEFAGLARRFVIARLSQTPWVDDVVQATLMSVDRARHTFVADRALAPWFYAIVRRRLIDMQRRAGRIARTEVAMDALPDPPVEARASRAAGVDIELVRQALAQLPPRQRAIVEAIQLRDEPTRHIAARLDMSQAAVKVAAHRGYKALRRLLGGAAPAANEPAAGKNQG